MSVVSQALGWTLIHFCWQATAIIVLYLAIDQALKKARIHTRYMLTLATLLSMFCLFVATLAYELHFSHEPNTQIQSFGFLEAHVGLLAHQSARLQLGTLLPWIDCAWWIGVLCSCARSIGGWWWLQRLRRATRYAAPAAVHARFRNVCAKLRVLQPPDLKLSAQISVPMTFGILRSIVLLPTSVLLCLNPDQLEAILAHELAHVRRADYFWNLLQTTGEALFFFHPAVWWIGRRLREQRELCCDDIAVEMCADPLLYASALFRLEDHRSAGLNLAMALDGHQSPSSFRKRILRVLGEPTPQSNLSPLRPLFLLAICAGVLLFLTPPPRVSGSISSQNTLNARLATPQVAPAAEASEAQFPIERPPQPAIAPDRLTSIPAVKAQASPLHQGSKDVFYGPSPHIALRSTSDEPPLHLEGTKLGDEPPPHIVAGSSTAKPPPHI